MEGRDPLHCLALEFICTAEIGCPSLPRVLRNPDTLWVELGVLSAAPYEALGEKDSACISGEALAHSSIISIPGPTKTGARLRLGLAWALQL